MRPLRLDNRGINRVMLSAKQDHAILTATLRLPPNLRDAFVLRVERKLHLRGSPVVSDRLVDDIIAHVAQQLQRSHD